MFGYGVIGIWLAYVVIGLVIYHKVFNVVYFDLSGALLKELGGAIAFATIMMWITIKFWLVAAIVLVVIGLLLSSKSGSRGLFVLFIIVAIIVSYVGHGFDEYQREKMNEQNNESITQTEG